jgi:UDP-2-acetamido-2,6-beta-L-arabino-hexul-4-ose reductase
MRVLVTGADGFIGKNLLVRLRELDIEHVPFTRGMSTNELQAAVEQSEFVFHLAGINRPKDIAEFKEGNADLTGQLCEAIRRSGRALPMLYTSSIQAELDNPYGNSKREAEAALERLAQESGAPVYIYRLPNVFGKWSRPNYNSAVATFCHNVAHDLPITINDPAANIRLVYVDDVVDTFISALKLRPQGLQRMGVTPEYSITVGELADTLRGFRKQRESLVVDRVGTGLTRALYATYLSFVPPAQFSYTVPVYADPRGRFVEMLKTHDSGQMSFFTAGPGVTRGGHYHHSKNEQFLVIQGKASFKFRHIGSGDEYELFTDGAKPEIVVTVPGWSHDITNVGDDEMIVMLWANEIFDRQRPDTVTYKVRP